MTFPGEGEDTRAGGAGLARVAPPTAPAFSILTVARRFDTDDRSVADGLPFAVRLDDGTIVQAFDRAFCASEDFVKDSEDPSTSWDFHRAGSYVQIACAGSPFDVQRWGPRVRDKAKASSIKRLARRLWFDEPNSGTGWASPSLMTTATDLTTSGPVHPTTAVGALIQAYADANDAPGDAILHVPPILASSLWAGGGIRVVNGRALGPLDIPISFGPYPAQVGLDGVDIDDDNATTLIVITGAVYAEVSANPFDAADPDGSLEAAGTFIEGHAEGRQNAHGVIAEVANLYAFDPDGVWSYEVYVPSPAASEAI